MGILRRLKAIFVNSDNMRRRRLLRMTSVGGGPQTAERRVGSLPTPRLRLENEIAPAATYARQCINYRTGCTDAAFWASNVLKRLDFRKDH